MPYAHDTHGIMVQAVAPDIGTGANRHEQLASAGAITHRPTEFGKLTEAINTAMSQSIATNITYLMPAWLLDRLSQSVVSAPLR